MTLGNLIFWTVFFGVIAVLYTCTPIADMLHPVHIMLTAVVLTVFCEHA